jgi:hypothetical protein
MLEKNSIPRVDAERWQVIRANKMNQRTAARVEQIGNSASPKHKRVLRDALNQWAKSVKLSEQFPAITDLLTAEAVYHLIYCERGHNARFERTIAVDVARAIVEGKTPEQCAQLFKSRAAYYQNICDRVAEWDRTGEIPQPHTPDSILDAEYIGDLSDDDVLSEEIITGVSKKPTRRIRISVKRFEKYGILRGDTAVVVMNGDVQMGELAYFAIPCNLQYKPSHYDHFTFVCERDSTCYQSNVGQLTPGGVCLRHDDVKKCNGHHDGRAYGRVCAVERKRQPVEHALELRPFDAREVIGDE